MRKGFFDGIFLSGNLMAILETERFRLCPVCENDRERIQVLCDDTGIKRFIVGDYEGGELDEVISNCLRLSQASFQAVGVGVWLIEKKVDRSLAGFIGFIEEYDPPELQLVYGFLPHARGGGGALECARAILSYIFDVANQVKLQQVVASVEPENLASVKTLQRLGFRRDGGNRYWSDLLGGKWVHLDRYVATRDWSQSSLV
jgi:ribosomal-protein-alanine N-acetyltransferase